MSVLSVWEFIVCSFSEIFSPKQVAKEGIPLPPDRTLCPLCLQKRANPSVMAVSGFVFCYTCVFKYTNQVRISSLTMFSLLFGNMFVHANTSVSLRIVDFSGEKLIKLFDGC